MLRNIKKGVIKVEEKIKKHSNLMNGIIYTSKDDFRFADELRKDAAEMGIHITDTILDVKSGIEVLKWHLANTSVNILLLNRMTDISTEPVIQGEILSIAKRNNITVFIKEQEVTPENINLINVAMKFVFTDGRIRK